MDWRYLTKILSIFITVFLSAQVLASTEPTPGMTSTTDLVNAGRQAFNNGHYEEALASWNVALNSYRKTDDTNGQARLLQYRAEAYLAMGQYYKATSNLQTALELADNDDNKELASQIAGSLGTAYMLSNRTDEARQLLEKAVASDRKNKQPGLAAVAGNNLGNLLASQGEYDAAITAYRNAISDAGSAGSNQLAIKGSVNIARALVDSKQQDKALTQLETVKKQVASLSPSHEKAYTLISIGKLYSRLSSNGKTDDNKLEQQAESTITEAVTVADAIADNRALSFAHGYLGELYENNGRTEDAMRHTRNALMQLHKTPAPEISYRWHWQEGRLLQAKGENDQAIRAYQRAVDNLQSVRPVLASGNTSKRGDFRDQAGQLYLDLADLLLQKSDTSTDTDTVKASLLQARNAVEMLKGAELEDYFRDNCVAELKAKTTGIDQLGKRTAAIYPIILNDRLEILVSLPDGMKRYTVAVSAEKLNEEINQFRSMLEKRTTHQYRRHAKQIYNWLIQPLEKDLTAQNVDTLVFIPDGNFRTIPLAALYDGKNFLITRYALATTPGLTLTDPQPLPRENMKLLVAGLTESVQNFPPLPDVADEVQKLDALYDGAILENNRFTQSNIEQELGNTPYSIVHVASHGKFQSNVQDTFLLTYDGKLNMDTLEGYMASTTYRDRPVELLTLSACQTAVGDDKAALGLGGVAVKAGARSAIATLWYINDQASSLLVSNFYENLKDTKASKASALQKAQMSMLNDPRFNHPSYWAPFLLIGNWL